MPLSKLEAAVQRHSVADAHRVHRLKLALAKLVISQAPPSAVNQLALAERFLDGVASTAELSDARQDAWAYVGSLACYCSRSDSASAQAVMSCLEAGAEAHSPVSLLEQAERVLLCGVSEEEVLTTLGGGAPAGESEPFDAFVAPYRGELHAHCYRMLGSLAEADDALQDTLLQAWRGLAGFEGRSALKSWLYRIATNVCLQRLKDRRPRLLADEYGPAAAPDAEMRQMLESTLWVEPYPMDPERRLEQLESVELAFVAALQHLPSTQRAALLLREVVELSATEVAAHFESSTAAIESALQRARTTLKQRAPEKSQRATLSELGEAGQRELTERFVRAWEAADVTALLALLSEDVKFTMPPLPNWFDGRSDVARFFAERIFATPWRLRPLLASGQLAFACYQGPDFRLGAMNVLTLSGSRISRMTGFLDPALHLRFRLPER